MLIITGSSAIKISAIHLSGNHLLELNILDAIFPNTRLSILHTPIFNMYKQSVWIATRPVLFRISQTIIFL